MNSHTHIIRLNGKRYDALTGGLIHEQHTTAAQSKRQKEQAPQVLDGFIRSAKKTATISVPAKSTAAKPRVSPQRVTHHKPQRSHTLMRHAVKKPSPRQIIEESLNPTTALNKDGLLAVPSAILAEREERAKKIHKSKFISRFDFSNKTKFVKRIDTLPVQPPPTEPLKANRASSAATTSATPHASSPFAAALNQAKSHEQKKPKRQRLHHRVARKLGVTSRSVIIVTLTAAALVSVGYIAYQKIPTIAMRVAATRAGIDANLPGYKPAGFSLIGPPQYSAGEVVVNYRSNSDERNFTITQRASGWNSETLLENFVQDKKPYQTFQNNKGMTVYCYGDSNATAVSTGLWLKVEGLSKLTCDQLQKIISSL